MKIEYLNGGTEDHIGFTRHFMVDAPDAPPIREQLDVGYAHGGGWRPFGASMWRLNRHDMTLLYPGDPPLKPRAKITFTHFPQEVWVYDSAWFLLLQPLYGPYEVCRMD